MPQRIKGQETRVTFTGPNGLEEGLSDVQDLEVELQMEVLTEGYLGETTNRRDDIFNGATGRVNIHLETSEYFRFAERVKNRAQRRDAASGRFDILTSLSFPNGERVRVLFEDAFFGALPLRVGGRGEYVQATINWETSDGRFLFS